MRRSSSPLFMIILLLLQANWIFQGASAHNDEFHHHAWTEFEQLSGYHKGQSHEVLPSLKAYLHHFGYLDIVSKTGFSPVYDENLEAAVKKYQVFFNLNATGVLDPTTVHQMIQPRCGMRDIIGAPAPAKFRLINITGSSSSKLDGASMALVWPPSNRQLWYSFWMEEDMPFPIEDVRRVFGAAFQTWAAVSAFSFAEISLARLAHLQIGFFKGEHLNCPLPFDGTAALLAHSYYPEDGRCHFNADVGWEIDPNKLQETEGSYDLESVALHEIGHLLGLDHSTDFAAAMYPVLPPQVRKVILDYEDVYKILALYPVS